MCVCVCVCVCACAVCCLVFFTEVRDGSNVVVEFMRMLHCVQCTSLQFFHSFFHSLIYIFNLFK